MRNLQRKIMRIMSIVIATLLVSANTVATNASPVVPGSPTNAVIFEDKYTSAVLTWSPPIVNAEVVQTYELQYAYVPKYGIDRGADWATIENFPASQFDYEFNAQNQGVDHYFRIRATSDSGNSEWTIFGKSTLQIAVSQSLDQGPYVCAVDTSNSIECWGSAPGLPSSVPGYATGAVVKRGIRNASSVYALINTTCSVLTNHQIQCWGSGENGILGNGSFEDSYYPVAVHGIENAGHLAFSNYYPTICASILDKTLKCWGRGLEGQLGNGATRDSAVPVTVQGIHNAVDIALGYQHACALLQDETIKCWGTNSAGELGNGTTSNSAVPVTVQGISTAVKLTVDGASACALLQDKTIKCWGGGWSGQLGNGATLYSANPVIVQGIDNAVDLELAGSRACALLENHTVKCWGSGTYGQLGNGASLDSSIPVAVQGISNAMDLSLSPRNACAILIDKTIKCWGQNMTSALGRNFDSPISINDIANVTEIAVADFYVCAVIAHTSIKCWGNGRYGQLGNRNTFSSIEPVSSVRSWYSSFPPDVQSATLDSTTTTSVKFRVNATSDAPISSYCARFRYSVLAPWQTQCSTNEPLALSGLQPAQEYELRIFAVSAAGTSAEIDASALTPAIPILQSVTQSFATSSSVGLLIETIETEPILRYSVKYRESGSMTWLTLSTDENPISLTGLQPAKQYEVRIAGEWAFGTSDELEITAVTTPLSNKPSAITKLTGSSTKPKTNKLTWSGAKSNGSAITKYEVHWKLSTAKSWGAWKSYGKATTATISGWLKGKKYNVQVRVTNAIGSVVSKTFTITQTK